MGPVPLNGLGLGQAVLCGMVGNRLRRLLPAPRRASDDPRSTYSVQFRYDTRGLTFPKAKLLMLLALPREVDQ